ncbi:hypothetical protein DRO32_01625, partial [Candidatus Bathyarchaeota archaeon]
QQPPVPAPVAPPAVQPVVDVKERLGILLPKVVRKLREEHGDLMLLSDFLAFVADEYEKKYGEERPLTIDEILEAVSDLVEKGVMAGMLKLESGVRIVRLSPEGFGRDELKVVEVASRRSPPQITLEELVKETGWPTARARAVLEVLERARVARRIPGSFTGQQDTWYFPGLERKLD